MTSTRSISQKLEGMRASRGWLLTVLLAFTLALAVGCGGTGEAEERNSSGLALAEQGRLEAAIAEYDEAIRLKPKYGEAYLNRGAIYTATGQLSEAVSDLTQAITLEPENARAYYLRGSAYAGIGEDEAAHAPFARCRLGRACPLAIRDLTKAIALGSQTAAVYRGRGIVQLGLGEPRRAVEDFDRALELEPDDAELYYMRGYAYLDSRKSEQAFQDFDHAVSLDPDGAAVYFNRGYAYARTGRPCTSTAARRTSRWGSASGLYRISARRSRSIRGTPSPTTPAVRSMQS